MTVINVVIPLSTYYGNCEWSITGYEYEKLIWSDENVPKPTLEELTTSCRFKLNIKSKLDFHSCQVFAQTWAYPMAVMQTLR